MNDRASTFELIAERSGWQLLDRVLPGSTTTPKGSRRWVKRSVLTAYLTAPAPHLTARLTASAL
jgi:hypothetical protein